VLYPRRPDPETLNDLRSQLSGIAPITVLSGEGAQGDPSNEGVKITTIHSAKGLQFRAVLLVWADLLPTHYPDRDETQERSLFYVALTRAEDVLALTCAGPSRYVDEFQKSILQARRSSTGPIAAS
jgi:superfamily I DNA/RNA helicase